MKITKTLLAGAFVLALAGTVSAQTTVRMTGSTAFRAQTISAIVKLLGGTVTGTPTSPATATISLPPAASAAYTGSAPLNANAGIYRGTIQGIPVIIKTSWSGSNGGIQVTAGSIPIQFFPDTQASTSGAGTSGVTPDPRTSTTAGTFESAVADVTMEDTFQTGTPFIGPYLGQNYETLTEIRVGIIPYRWVASKNAPVSLNNMTTLAAQAQWTGTGELPLAFYTGNPADTTPVFATGRNPASGTRNAAFSESGIGALTSIQQRDPATAGNTLYPPVTINGIPYGLGQGGEDSGGTVANKIAPAAPATAPVSGQLYVSYLGINDSTTAINQGGREMSWNGVPYSIQNVIEGRYTFWTYQFLAYRGSTTGNVKTVADAIANQILLEDSPILLPQMKVGRDEDGGVVNVF